MSPKLLALLRVEAAPGDGGRWLLSSTVEWVDEAVSLNSWDGKCGGCILDESVRLIDILLCVGGTSPLGVADAEALCRGTRWRCWEACEDCDVVDPCEARRASGMRESFARLHGEK